MVKPLDKIRQDDPWYTADQRAAAESPHQRRIIRKRIAFLLKAIDEFKASKTSPGPLRILDAGCGDGVLLKTLAELPNIQLFGVDYNPLRVQRAQARVPSATVKEGDLTSLEFPNGSFDIVVISQVLEHIQDDLVVLKDLARVLNKTGWLLLGVPNEGCLLARLRNHLLQPDIARTTDHVHFYTERTIRLLLDKAGLVVNSLMREGFFTPYLPLHSWFAAREWGHRTLEGLGKVFPSQAAGVYLICMKRAG
ncbi:MAG: class I SAM-dependent methyltransferase [candidate division NC10 bacterium]|nr:class I SAM-dependent methyltransferase [candidate division NC10 bacterium]